MNDLTNRNIIAPTQILSSTNVWADSQVDEEDAIAQSLAPMILYHEPEIPPVVTPDTILRRQHNAIEGIAEESLACKRVAVAGPNQRTLDDLREREEMSRQKALEHSVRIKAQEAEIQRLRQQHEEQSRRHAEDAETEAQLTQHVLQYEREVNGLKDVNNSLKTTLAVGKQQFEDLSKQYNDLKAIIEAMKAETQREKITRDNEILGLRQRLQAAETELPSAPVTPQRTRVSTSRVVQGSRLNIGVVPLRPTATPSPPNTNSNRTAMLPLDVSLDLGSPEGEHNVRTLVREVIQQIGADISVAKTTSPKGRRKCSARSENQQAIAAQKSVIPNEHDLAWKQAVRRAWKTHYNIRSIEDFAEYTPAPQAQVIAFETGPNGPDNQNTLDFGKGYEKSRWNRVILKRFVNDLLDERQEDISWNISDVPEKYLFALFSGQLKRSREAWRLIQNRPNIDEGRMETTDEVSQRIEISSAQRLAIVGSRSRRERKFERRTKAVEKIITVKALSSAPDLGTWQYFRDLLQKLSVDGMSSEEEGVTQIGNLHVPVFYVKICPWRNPVVGDYFKYIDKESQNPAIRGTRGSKLHPRLSIEEHSATPAPTGLPECLYNPQWLENQTEIRGQANIDEELMVSREVFELLEFVAHVDGL